MDTMKTVGKWCYLVGFALAIVAALANYAPDWLSWVLAGLAILTGLFLADPKELTNYGVRYLALLAVATALDAFPLVGPYLTSIAYAMVAFFGPIILTVLFVFNFKQAYDWITSK